MPLTTTERISRAAKSKMLVGNVASTTLTTTTTKVATAATKLSNQDKHNERVAASVDENHLRHAMLGNFNQQNELWVAQLESNNSSDMNSRCGEAEEQCKRQKVLRLNGDMNYGNSMQQATTTRIAAVATKSMFGKMSDVSNNTSEHRCDIYIKHNYDQRRRDNEESLNSLLPMKRVCNTPTSTAGRTAAYALSVAPIPIDESAAAEVVFSTPAAAPTCHEHSSSTPSTSTALAAVPLLRANGALNSNTVGGSKTTKRHVGRKAHSGCGKRRRRIFAQRQRAHFKASNSTTEIAIESAKLNTAIKAGVTKSVGKAPALNSAALTSFILNSSLLALCNATAVTALSAVAATLSETISNAAGADPPLPHLPPPSDNDVWSGMQNSTFTNFNSSNDAVGVLNMAAGGVARDIKFNNSDILLTEEDREYIFDRRDVRIIFITLYSLVFCCCVFGNLLVILVVTLSRRLRSITNFFLANLALADFCVGVFCVLQNLSIYLIESWVFGEFLCRMYQFVHSLSYTASIFILVVICMERYFAIVHPITCKQILTAARLRIVILTVWVTSAVYSTPKFLFSKTIKNIHTEDGQEEEICVLDRKMFNSKLLDMINFGLLYVIPLLVMTVLYSKIAIALWRSSHGLSHHLVTQHQHQQQQQQQQQQQDESMSLHNSMYHHQQHPHQNHQHHHVPHNHHLPQTTTHAAINHQHNNLQQIQTTQQLPAVGVVGMGDGGVVVCGGTNQTSGLLSRKQSSKYEKRGVSITESQVSLDAERPIVSACRNGSSNNGIGSGVSGGSVNSNHKSSFRQHHHHHSSTHPQPHQRPRVTHMSHSSNNVLRARRGVVRMLIIFVLTFALCNLPYHARKMWQYWSRSYRGDSNFNALLTPLTFLVTYFNSGINPLLYAFLSRNFRKGMKELLLCSWKKGKGKSSTNSSLHHKRVALQTHSLPTDTTHIGNEQL